MIRSRRRHVVTGAEGLQGERGEVKSWNQNRGKVFVHGEIWDARCGDSLARGDEAEVESVEGMTLVVKRVEKLRS